MTTSSGAPRRPSRNATHDLGDLKQVRIRHDNTGSRPGWFLDQIRVREETTDQEWVFPASRWLARDEDDSAIERILDLA